MKYEAITKPEVQYDYSDRWEAVMTIDVQREDGEVGIEVWIVAGVPAHLRDTSDKAGATGDVEKVRVFGDSIYCWCPANFQDDAEVQEGVLAAVEAAALEAWHLWQAAMAESEARNDAGN